MINLDTIAKGDLLPAFRGTVVRTNVGIGGASLGAPVFVTVTEWDSGREATFMLTADQFADLEVWE